MTSQQVLEILLEHHRQMAASGDAISILSFGMETTVDDWRFAMLADCWHWRNIGVFLNWLFGTSFSPSEWQQVLFPYGEKTLRGVCELIASQATVPRIEPLSFMGRPCTAAGGFLTLRESLAADGVDVSEFHPSTPFGECLRNHLKELYRAMIRIGTGRVPAIRIVKTPYDISEFGLFIAFVGLVTSGFFCAWDHTTGLWIAAGSGLLLLLAILGMWLASRLEPSRIETGGIETIRDLCEYIAQHITQSPDRNGLRGRDAGVSPA